jgi:hypothetical protein
MRLPGAEAKAHQRDTPNNPIPGGAQCPDQKSLGVEDTHLLGVLQRLQPDSAYDPVVGLGQAVFPLAFKAA